MPPRDSVDNSNYTTFSSPGHFSIDQQSAGEYTLFHTSEETPGLLDGCAFIFFRLHASGKLKSKVCIAPTFQVIRRGSIPSLHFLILSSTSRAAPMRGAMTGDVTTSSILLLGGYRRHSSCNGLDPASHACWFYLSCAYTFGQAGTRVASPEPFTIGRRLRCLGLNWTWEKSSPPIRHLELFLISNNIHSGSAIPPSSLSSLASPLTYFSSIQFSTEQSTTETRLTYSTEFLYAFICISTLPATSPVHRPL